MDQRYQKISTKLKRWSFDSKMAMAFQCSSKAADPYFFRSYDFARQPLPDEIEAFIMLSVKSEEWRSGKMTKEDFLHIIQDLRSFRHPKLNIKGEDLAKWLFPIITGTQLVHQKEPFHRIGRHIEYFTYINDSIDMGKEIKCKFGLSYEEIIGPTSFLWFTTLENSILKLYPEAYKWILERYKRTWDLLTITREQYIIELDKQTNKQEDLRYCLCPSYTYPFILYDNRRYLAAPHLLIKAATESIMFRLTDDNNELRKLIGKHVLESYLYRIIKENDQFDEVLPEQTYGGSQQTLDVLTRIGEDILCFDSKSSTPPIALRTFSENAYENTKKILVKNVVKAYKQIYLKYGTEYSYFETQVKEDKSNIFAVVVLAENPGLIMEEIYSDAAQQLHINNPSPEYDWLRGHIGITDIAMIETELFERTGIMEAVKRNMQSKQYSDLWFAGRPSDPNKETPEFILNGLHKLWSGIEEEAQRQGIRLCWQKN